MVYRWKWFQRKQEPMDVVERPAYAHRGGAYGGHVRPTPSWNCPTVPLAQDRPLLTRGGVRRSSQAGRRSHGDRR